MESPEVDEVVRPGYMQGDRVLRAAQVAVRQPPKREKPDTVPDDEAEGETGADV